ncbi:MAG TPA: hypothetical protein PLH02_00275 [Bacillota bacterium]|nr:hypothetical protein [Bacillota bacterium]HPF42382.1 hypothetical protein [Bacillota bacterium]HPJ85405.1 hypothetical protein [Bacillota bacterium]HPQ61299.1 hypothetical protein [Bacillota bacterium]HRX91931.1 hypothetical protein [Candidatus Izemoplasmatales bacterium]
MEAYFELFLKGICTIFILYVSFNTIFRYHTNSSVTDFFLVFSWMIVSFFFIGHYLIVAYVSIIGGILIIYAAMRIYLAYRKTDIRLTYSFSKREADNLKIALGNASETLPEGKIYNYRNLSYIIITKDLTKDEHKAFVKKLDKEISQVPIHFGYFQYFNIIFALILMASIWRF